MKLKIEKPDWYKLAPKKKEPWNDYEANLDHWFDTYVEPINKLLAEGVEVRSCPLKYTWAAKGTDHYEKNNGFSALLINIEPIRKETAEDVLRDLVALMEKYNSAFVTNEEYKRAKRVLEES